MRRIFVLLSAVVLLSVGSATGQLVDPLSLVNSVEIGEGPNNGFIKLLINLREVEAGGIPLENLQLVECVATEGSRRAAGYIFTSAGTVLQPHCNVELGDAQTTLKHDWNRFDVSLQFKVRETSTSPWSTKSFKVPSPVSRCLKASDVSVTVGVTKRTGPNTVSVTLTSNADTRVKVGLKPSGGTGIVATPSGKHDSQDTYLEAKKPREVQLTLIPGTTFLESPTQYNLVIEPLQNALIRAVNTEGAETFTIPPFVQYQLTAPQIKVLDDGVVEVNFSSTDRGRVSISLNSARTPFYSEEGNGNRTVRVKDNIRKGANFIEFSGVSTSGFELSGDRVFAFEYDVKPALSAQPITVGFDEEGNKLRIGFALTRPTQVRWQFKDRNGFGANVDFKDPSKNLYEASIDLKLSPQNLSVVTSNLVDIPDTKLQKAPVEIEIYERSGSGDAIASFTVVFIRPNSSVNIDKVKEAEKLALANQLKDAAKAIAEAFGFPRETYKDNPQQKAAVEAALPQLRNGSNTKAKIYGILGFAGKIAAGFFGIPLPI